MGATEGIKYQEALQIWLWIRWRLTQPLILHGEEFLKSDQPVPSDPELIVIMDGLLDPATPLPDKRLLLEDLLQFVKDVELPWLNR